MSLRQRLEGIRVDVPTPDNVIADEWGAVVDLIKADGIEARTLDVGDAIPRFSLPDVMGKSVAVEDKLATGPVVIVFYRGGWCPYCNTTLHAYADLAPQIMHRRATLLAISPQTPQSSAEIRDRINFPFEVLSDWEGKVADQFGVKFRLTQSYWDMLHSWGIDLAEYNGGDELALPFASVFVANPEGIITWQHVNIDYTQRAEPGEMLAALNALY